MEVIVEKKKHIGINNIKLFLGFLFLIVSFSFINSSTFAQSRDDCLACHDDNEITTERNGKEVSLYVDVKILDKSPHKKLSCVTCHKGFDPDEVPHKENIKPINCLNCHNKALVQHPFHPKLLETSGITNKKGYSCKACHGTHDVVSPKVKGSKFYKDNIVKSCGACHKNEEKKYLASQHYKAYSNGEASAPNCLTCHKSSITSKTIKADSLNLKLYQEKLCLSCHLADKDIVERTSPSAGFINSYEKSVHGKKLLSGNNKVANCVSCHNSHDILPSKNSTSTINKFNIPSTCGKCHQSIEKEYTESIHGVALKKGMKDAPVCTDCHGEHDILNPNDPRSPVSFKNVSSQVCSKCHSSVKLSQKFGILPDRFKTYEDSYHGLALSGGSVIVANCSSCHGKHNIKPASDSTSTINIKNLPSTCGKCHQGANQNFAKSKIHISIEPTNKDIPILYWISTGYILLIIVVIGGMFIHNILDFIKKSKIKKLKQRGLLKEEVYPHNLYLRMNLNERIQHFILAFSFIVLIFTGFMLKFPDVWWVKGIRDIWTDAFIYRGLFHRIAAVTMILVSFYHLYYILFTKRGKQLIRDLLPKYQDLIDAISVAKYNLGISNVKPKLDRFSYIEKAEYWALIWGTILMTVTGLILWFDNTFIGLFTKLGLDIASTIHYYEAWLAFLAIVVWHFYFVIFNPDVYPLNLACVKGTISEEEMAEDHILELERIKRGKDSDKKEEDKS